MQTAAHAPKGTERTGSARRAAPGRARPGPDRDVGTVAQLQRAAGNQAVARLLRPGGAGRGAGGVLQRAFGADAAPARSAGGGPAGTRAGLPGPLRAGLESLSGMDLSGVRVHRSSPLPAGVGALAYTQGRDIYVGPGQERHLPHEGWHAVQQLQGRVKPTLQAKGAAINDDPGLEREADVMGAKALRAPAAGPGAAQPAAAPSAPLQRVVQRTIGDGHDLTAPWVAGDLVLEAIYDNERVMRNGDSGTAVMKVQQLLFYLGFDFPVYGADGIFGPETEAAVVAFQRAHVDEAGTQLVDDGVVGPLTMGALNREADLTGTNLGNLIRTAPLPALQGPPTAVPRTLTVDRIDIVDSPAGAIGGYPDIVGDADLNVPGPFNDAVTGETKNVHQIHFHLDNGSSADLTPRRELQRSAFRAGVEAKNPPDQPPAGGGAGPPIPGGFGGILVGPDGPPAHEIQRPTADKLVVADAPGSLRTPAADYPYIYRSHFTLTAEDGRGAPIARIKYDVLIERTSAADVPNTENRIVAVEKKDFVRGKNL
jgi:peptidoglycan hydrolase-like protein with peptidoglycan-binding domain